jgi:putative membrane protein
MKHYGKYLAGLAALGLLWLVPAAPAQSDSQKRAGEIANRLSSDANFANSAAQGGRAEVEMAKLAEGHASSDSVKQFAQRMIDDHTKANDELKQVASQKSMTLPTGISAKDQATMDHLSKLNGAEFDRAYMMHMVADHKKDVTEFKREADRGTDPDVKAFASKTLPTLEEHLSLAEKTDARVRTEGKK